MAPLAVDPVALDGAGSTVMSVGEGLGSVISTLTTSLTGCDGMAGDDPAGSAFGSSYNTSASKLLQAMATTRNGLCCLGYGVRMSAHNYSTAEAMSNASGHGQPLPGPHPTGSISANSVLSAVGHGVGAPTGWGWVSKYIGMIWPNGDSAKLRAAAAAWTSAGTNFEVSEILGATGPMASIGAQQIPEASAITAAFADANRSAAGILKQCATIAVQLNTLASKIDTVHAAIIDLLSRICDPMTGIKEVWEFLTDEDEDEIKKIANDIRVIVNQFTSEVGALRQQIASAVTEATTILTTMGRYAEREWDQFLHHTDVGRALNQVGQYGKGLAESVGGLFKDGWTYGPIREFIDPQGSQQSWKELINGMAPLVGLGDNQAPGVAQSWKDLGKNAVHWDGWSTNPAEAAGKSTFDIATLLIPGGGEAAAAAKGGRAAADAAEAASAASRAETAATRGLEDAAVLHTPAPAPHPETPAAPRPLGPPADRPPPPTDKPVTPSPTKPASAPTDGPTPHGPTESKPPATNPETSAPARSTSLAEQHPVLASAPAHAPKTTTAIPDETAGPRAGSGGPPQSHIPDLSSPGSHLSPLQGDGALATRGGGEVHGAGDGGHGSGDGHGSDGGQGGSGGSGESHGSGDGHAGGDSVSGKGPHDPVHSHEKSGDGWERLPDEARQLDYGSPLEQHWQYSHNPVDPSQVHPDVAQLLTDPDAPFGRDPHGNPYTQHEYEERFNKEGPNGQHWYNFASNDGALEGTKVAFNDFGQYKHFYGQQLDRIGDEDGKYLGIVEGGKSPPWESRAMHIDSLSKALHNYTIDRLPEGWQIEVCEIEPAVGQPGGAMQVRIINSQRDFVSVDELLYLRILR
jgi:hypothetical protein